MTQDVKNNIKLVLIVAVAVIIAVGGLFLLKGVVHNPVSGTPNEQVGGQEIDTSTSALSDIEGWQMYRNNEFGFEFKYPETLVLQESALPNGVKIEFMNAGDQLGGLGSIAFGVTASSKTQLQEYFNGSAALGNVTISKVGPYDAIQFLDDTPPSFGEVTPIYADEYILLHNEKEYSLNVVISDWNLIQQILSTFRFVNFSEGYNSCRDGENPRVNKDYPYKEGSLVFKAKEGTKEETILESLGTLGYSLERVESPWSYSGVDRSTLFVRHTVTPVEAESIIRPIISEFELAEEHTGFYYGSASAFFTGLLSEEQKQKVSVNLDILKEEGKITEYGWNYAPKQLYGFVSTAVGKEDEYIQKLYKLNIFDCVSKALNIDPVQMPTVPL